MALLPKLAKHIASNHPTGKGIGGPTRISWIAARHLAIEEEEERREGIAHYGQGHTQRHRTRDPASAEAARGGLRLAARGRRSTCMRDWRGCARRPERTCRRGRCSSATRSSLRSSTSALRHERSGGGRDYLRDAAFTTLNRFVALKMLEARELVQECITKGEQSVGLPRVLRHGAGRAAPARQRGLPPLHRVPLRRAVDRGEGPLRPARSASVLWPKRATFEALLEIAERHRARGRVGRGRDHRLGLPVLQRPGTSARRCARRARRRATAASWPFATSSSRRATSSSSSPTTRSGACGSRCRARAVALAERCEYLVREPKSTCATRAEEGPARPARPRPGLRLGPLPALRFDLLLTIYEEAWADPRCRARVSA